MEPENPQNPIKAFLKAYVLPVIFWCLAAIGTITFISEDVTSRLDRIESNIKIIMEEQERVKEQLEAKP